jgi:hypothetical protein
MFNIDEVIEIEAVEAKFAGGVKRSGVEARLRVDGVAISEEQR